MTAGPTSSEDRFLLVLPSFQVGGAERVVILLARELARRGAQVTLVAIDGRGPLRAEVDGVEVIDLGRHRALTSLPALIRAIRCRRPTVVISSQTHVSTLLALTRRSLGDIRLVVREPATWIAGPSERGSVRVLRRLVHRRTDLVLASSEEMRAQLAGLMNRPVEVLPNPVDVDALRARAVGAVREPGSGRRFACVGRLAEGKGLDDLLIAFSEHAEEADHLSLVGDGPLRSDIESTVARLRLGGRVRITGMLADPIPLIAGADALVLPSYSEGMPNVALEALAVGTPVLATTDLVTLRDLAQLTPAGALRLVDRAGLGAALSNVPMLGVGGPPRPVLLPDANRMEHVIDLLLHRIESLTDGRLRILMPTLSPYPSALASSVQSANMAQALSEMDHDVMLVAANSDPTLVTVAGATDAASLYGFTPAFRTMVLSERSHRGQSYTHALRMARIARRERPDLVLSRDLRGSLIPARLGIPTVFEAHSLTALIGRQERWILRRLLCTPAFRGFIVISEPLAEDLADEFGVPRDRILVAHDAVRIDDATSPTDAPPAGPSPERDGLPLRVGYVGSLFAGRGIELLVEVAARAPWLELHLVGGPADSARTWQARVAGASGARVVVHGMVTPMRARELQREADVLVAPFARKVGTDSGVDTSRWMSPMKVFEYMASGRPIVISDLPVLREVLRPDIDALMVEPEDPDALLSALERLRDDPELGRRLAASALDRVRTEFTWSLRARRILQRFVPERTGGRERA
jgi:glycosyltransferase involved in cell wall biosynthesis